MRYGVQLAAASPSEAQVGVEAERLGYDSVWVGEAYGADAATPLGWLAARTERIRLGSAILQIPGRSPALAAMTAATLDRLSGGRALLGLGASGPQVSEGWHGVRFARQLDRTRDYIAVVRRALAREQVRHRGATLELPLPGGPGKALKLTIAPVQERIPVYLAAIGPRNTALAGEIADGVLPALFAPEHAATLTGALAEGATRAGRTLADVDLAPAMSLEIGDDLARARDAMRPHLALYVGGMGSRQRNFYNELACRYGFADAARRVQEHYLAGRREEAMAALPGELIDAVALCGPADRVRDRLRAHRAAGVGTLIVSPVAREPDRRVEQLRLLAAIAEGA
jgi:F420-dependent oxidoreductase-like protein